MCNTELCTVRDCIESDPTLKTEWMKLTDSKRQQIGKEVKHVAELEHRYFTKKPEYVKKWLAEEILPQLLDC